MASSQRRLSVLLIFALVPALILLPLLFRGETVGPFDQVRQMAPWNANPPATPWDVLPVDGVLQFYPWRDLVLESWREGRLPAWNPYALGGTPLLANSQSAALYPPHIVLGALGVPTPLAVVLLLWFHLAWAGLGTYLLVRTLGGNRAGGVIAGISLVLSPFLVAWGPLASVPSTVAWYPWLLAGVAALAQGNTRQGWPTTVAATGMMLLAGHLQFSAYGLIGGVILGALLSRGVVQAGSVALALGFGGLLAMPQALPSLRFSEFSHRRNVPTEEGFAAYNASALQPWEAANLVYPFVLGNPREAADEEGRVSSYWPGAAKRGANFAEGALTLGPLVLILMLLAPWRNRSGWALAAAAVVSLLLAFGSPLGKVLYFGFPGWSSTGSPGRAIALFAVVACALAGLGWSRLDGAPKAARIAAAGGLILMAVVCLLLPGLATVPEEASPLVAAGRIGAIPFVLLGVGLVAAWLIGSEKATPRLQMATAMALALGIGMASTAGLLLSGRPLEGGNLPAGRIAVVNDAWGLSAAAPALYPPNTLIYGRGFELGGYDSLIHRDTVRILNEINGQDSAPPANGNMMFIKPTASEAALRQVGVTEVWSWQPLFGRSPDRMEGSVGVYVLDGGDRLQAAPGARWLAQKPGELGVEIAVAGPVRIAERNLPGWSAELNGRPMAIEGDWLAVTADQPGTLRFTYRPPGLSEGLLLGFVGLLGLILGTILARTRHNKRHA